MWVIDFESSGLHRSSYPIEVGITNGETEYQALIRPMEHWLFWSDASEKIHGLSRQMLFEEGHEARHVAFRLNDLLKNAMVYCDAIKWDSFWCRVLFSDNGIHQHFQLCDLTDLFEDGAQVEQFLQEREQLTSSGKYTLHRALHDARLMHSALRKSLS
jgi:hypothetical protein